MGGGICVCGGKIGSGHEQGMVLLGMSIGSHLLGIFDDIPCM